MDKLCGVLVTRYGKSRGSEEGEVCFLADAKINPHFLDPNIIQVYVRTYHCTDNTPGTRRGSGFRDRTLAVKRHKNITKKYLYPTK